VIGTFSGMLGIGGGIIAIPAMMMLLGFSQVKANGTTLAMMLPPIGLFAALAYSRAGNVDWKVAMLMSVGFAVGAYVGALFIEKGWIHPTALRILFAMLLLYVAARLLFRPGGRSMAALETSLLMFGFGGTSLVMRVFSHWLARSPGRWGDHYRRRHRPTPVDDYEI
jgi:uncharacterized membrane protein YfcA